MSLELRPQYRVDVGRGFKVIAEHQGTDLISVKPPRRRSGKQVE
jgi:hypothetical protein